MSQDPPARLDLKAKRVAPQDLQVRLGLRDLRGLRGRLALPVSRAPQDPQGQLELQALPGLQDQLVRQGLRDRRAARLPLKSGTA